MARIRTIKPEFWSDGTIIECSPNARLLFIGTWNFADDHGNLDRGAKQLKAQIFPADNLDCEPLIQELMSRRLLVEYSANGKNYLHIQGFSKHQRVDKPGPARCPPYKESQSPQLPFDEDSESIHGGKGREGKVKEGNGDRGASRQPDPTKGKKVAAYTLPSDFDVDVEMAAWAHKLGLSDKQIDSETEKFKDNARQKGAKWTDWEAAWRNWIRKAIDDFGLPVKPPAPKPSPQLPLNGNGHGALNGRDSWWHTLKTAEAKGLEVGVIRKPNEPLDPLCKRIRSELDRRKAAQ